MKRKQRWQDWVILIAGIWLFITPWLFGYSRTNFSWDAFVMGILFIIFSIGAIANKKYWEEWVTLIVGIWIFISPWILGFADMSSPSWNMYIVGGVTLILSLWGMSVTKTLIPQKLVSAS